jgi:hypothetical protein
MVGRRTLVSVLGILAGTMWAAGAAGGAAEAQAARAQEAGETLGRTIDRAIKADGPFFTAEERAVIERKCGYAPGSWDGFEANMSDGVFRCGNGKRVDDPEMRALMAAAGRRIGARVEAVMESAEVKAAIARVSEEATREALAAVDHARIAERAARDAEVAVRKAMEAARESLEERRVSREGADAE